MPKLVEVSSLSPAVYNPRRCDPERLELVKLSLRKLGFLLPIYATADGEIISGHQRITAAVDLGWTHVPVEELPNLDDEARKSLNLVFNRATNDMPRHQVSADAWDELSGDDLLRAAESAPDVEGDIRFPCMAVAMIDPALLIQKNAGRWNSYLRSMAAMLRGRGVTMPIVIDQDRKVVNGIGRLQDALERHRKAVPVVEISRELAGTASALMNLLSMDFDVREKYGDLLRYNSFRRQRLTRRELGCGFTAAVRKVRKIKKFDHRNPEHVRFWKSFYGDRVVDFGAGLLSESGILRELGVSVAAFEPFLLDGDQEIDRPAATNLARRFLGSIAEGQPFSSVFCSSVLNSVPFADDRRHVIRICAALAWPTGRAFFHCRTVTDNAFKAVIQPVDFKSRMLSKDRRCRLDYEEGIVLGDMSSNPKVQKYYTPRELRAVLEEFFESVQVWQDGGSTMLSTLCAKPKEPDWNELAESLRFEYNLPYPDGSRMDLGSQAETAFQQRLTRLKAVPS